MTFGKNIQPYGCYTRVQVIDGKPRPYTVLCDKHEFLYRYDIKVLKGTRTITIGDVVDAIEKDGLTKAKRTFFESNLGAKFNSGWGITRHGYPVAACSLGQAAINLNVDMDSLCMAFDKARRSEISAYIVDRNDNYDDTLSQIAARVREVYFDDLGIKLGVDEFDYAHPPEVLV